MTKKIRGPQGLHTAAVKRTQRMVDYYSEKLAQAGDAKAEWVHLTRMNLGVLQYNLVVLQLMSDTEKEHAHLVFTETPNALPKPIVVGSFAGRS